MGWVSIALGLLPCLFDGRSVCTFSFVIFIHSFIKPFSGDVQAKVHCASQPLQQSGDLLLWKFIDIEEVEDRLFFFDELVTEAFKYRLAKTK